MGRALTNKVTCLNKSMIFFPTNIGEHFGSITWSRDGCLT